eukprot:SAG31_NODE_1722_length_7452_cov_2.771658_4_plen_55_part_00
MQAITSLNLVKYGRAHTGTAVYTVGTGTLASRIIVTKVKFSTVLYWHHDQLKCW